MLSKTDILHWLNGWNQIVLNNSMNTMLEKLHIPFVPPTFSWNSPNLNSQFKIFKQKVEFAFKGTFLFLTHNQNTHLREELLKSMKTTGSLHDALQIACLAEGTMHAEELSKQYLDAVKKDTQIDSIHHNKPKHEKRQGKGHGQQHCSNSGKQGPKTGRNSHNCWSKHPPRRCPAYGKKCHYCKKKGHYSKCCHTRADSQLLQHKSRKELHDMKQEPHGSGQYFEFEQDGISVIHFGNNVKGFKGNSNVLFDEIDGPNQRILTDLCVQGASNLKDYKPVLKCRFKVESGVCWQHYTL